MKGPGSFAFAQWAPRPRNRQLTVLRSLSSAVILATVGCCCRLRAAAGCGWLLLVAPGCSWLLLATAGWSWVLLAAPACSLRLLAAPGCSCLLLGAAGCSWRLLAESSLSVYENSLTPDDLLRGSRAKPPFSVGIRNTTEEMASQASNVSCFTVDFGLPDPPPPQVVRKCRK